MDFNHKAAQSEMLYNFITWTSNKRLLNKKSTTTETSIREESACKQRTACEV